MTMVMLNIDRELREIAALGLAKDVDTVDALYAGLQALSQTNEVAAADPMRGPVLDMVLAFIELRSAAQAYTKSREAALAAANQPLTDKDFGN